MIARVLGDVVAGMLTVFFVALVIGYLVVCLPTTIADAIKRRRAPTC